MSGQSNAQPPGWMYAQGDPPGTVRYWNGSEWQGEPRSAAPPGAVPPGAVPPGAVPPGALPPGVGAAPPFVASRTGGKSRAKLILGLILAAVLFLGGCFYFAVSAGQKQTEVAEAFLTALDAQDFDAVAETLDARCFDEGELEEMETYFEGFELTMIRELRSTSVNVGNNGTSGEVMGEVTATGGEDYIVEMTLTNRDGWKICSFFFEPVEAG